MQAITAEWSYTEQCDRKEGLVASFLSLTIIRNTVEDQIAASD
jgi:hypothetical protein